MHDTVKEALKELSSEKLLEVMSNVFGSRFTDMLEDTDLKQELSELGYLEDFEEEE